MIVRETALEVGLELRCPAADVPRSVVQLRSQQEVHALLVGRARDRQLAGFAQRG